RLQVLAHTDFQRGLAIAEEVIRCAHTRRDVLEATHAGCPRERERWPEAMRLDAAVLALGEEAADVLVAQAALQRQSRVRPLILDEERVGNSAIAGHRRADALRQLIGNAVVEAVGDLLTEEAWGLGDL